VLSKEWGGYSHEEAQAGLCLCSNMLLPHTFETHAIVAAILVADVELDGAIITPQHVELAYQPVPLSGGQGERVLLVRR